MSTRNGSQFLIIGLHVDPLTIGAREHSALMSIRVTTTSTVEVTLHEAFDGQGVDSLEKRSSFLAEEIVARRPTMSDPLELMDDSPRYEWKASVNRDGVATYTKLALVPTCVRSDGAEEPIYKRDDREVNADPHEAGSLLSTIGPHIRNTTAHEGFWDVLSSPSQETVFSAFERLGVGFIRPVGKAHSPRSTPAFAAPDFL